MHIRVLSRTGPVVVQPRLLLDVFRLQAVILEVWTVVPGRKRFVSLAVHRVFKLSQMGQASVQRPQIERKSIPELPNNMYACV